MNKKLEFIFKNKAKGGMEIKNSVAGEANLYIYGDIVSDQWGKWTNDDTCPTDIADFLKDINQNDKLNVYINSGGGSVFGGLAIYNQLKRHQGEKTVYIDGLAASIASIIALAGDKVVIPSNAMFMIHKPLTWCWGNANDLQEAIRVLDICEKSIMSIYMDNVVDGVEEDTVKQLVNDETWFTGEDLKEYFNVEVVSSAPVVACTSDFYNSYENTPQNIKNVPSADNEHLKAIKEMKEFEDKKNAILSDLDYYGV